VKENCEALGISESWYYRRKKRKKKGKKEHLLLKIKEIIEEHEENKNYGARRIEMRLKQKGEEAGYGRIYRVMKEAGLIKKRKRYSKGITKEDKEAQKSENLIGQNFRAEKLNEKWVGDITEVQCYDGKIYTMAIMDCYNGEIVGLETRDNMRKELCIEGFEAACKRRGARGMIMHTDRGSQFTSGGYRESLKKAGAKQSMSGVGNCYDNARIESFFATLKKEKLYRIKSHQRKKEEVKSIIFRYVHGYYNRCRVNTANPKGWAPIEYIERKEKKAA
jgi:transposase InsO family protein